MSIQTLSSTSMEDPTSQIKVVESQSEVIEKLPYESIKKITGDSTSFMIYGHGDTLSLRVIEDAGLTMKKRTNVPLGQEPFSEIYNYTVGIESMNFYRPDGSKMVKMDSGWVDTHRQSSRRTFKTGLTIVIVDNLVRKCPITPIIFATKISFMEPPARYIWRATPETILSRTAKNPEGRLHNRFFTPSELRRAHKLCTDKGLPLALKQMARRTLKFVEIFEDNIRTKTEVIREEPKTSTVYVDVTKTITYSLKEIPAPWEGDNAVEFERQLRIRKATTTPPTTPKPCWRTQVKAIIYTS